MSRQPTPKERTKRAFRAYLDLLDAEEELKAALRWPLELVDLTLEGFRLLAMLHREGALPLTDITKRRRRDAESTKDVVARLEKHGWVRRAIVNLPPVEFERAHLPRSKRNEPRQGRLMVAVALTRPGKEFIAGVIRRYSTLFKRIMGGVEARELETLSRVCRKLREGDIFKFLREIRMQDEEEEAAELAEKVEHELERARWVRMRRRLRMR